MANVSMEKLRDFPQSHEAISQVAEGKRRGQDGQQWFFRTLEQFTHGRCRIG